MQAERVILGIDPGTSVTGYGLIKIIKKQPYLLQYGVIHLKKYGDHATKLKKIFDRVLQLIKEYAPGEIVVEAPFYGKNVQSMLKLGRAQGVVIAAALSLAIPVVEYAPKKVKQSVTGNGSASKEQIAHLLENLLAFKFEKDNLLDATDALAVALCHFYQGGRQTTKAKSWKTFLTNNPHRISSPVAKKC